MPLDPSIILAGKPPDFGPDKIMSMLEFAQGVQRYRQQQGDRNALKQILQSPKAFDPTTNQLTPETIQATIKVNPEIGLKLQSNQLEDQVRRAQLSHAQTETGKTNWDFMSQVAGIGTDAYEEAKRGGASEDDAIAAAAAARNDAAQNNGGIVGADVVKGITSKPFDPRGARALANTSKEWATLKGAEASRDEAKRRDDLTEKRDKDRNDIQDRRDALADRRLEVQERYQRARDTRADEAAARAEKRFDMQQDAATIDPADEGDKSLIASIANYRMKPPSVGRNPQYRRAVMEEVLKANPDYQEGRYDQATKALRDFGTGKQGDAARSLNVGVSHLETLRELGTALNNGDVQLINAAKQSWQEQFGEPAPTNFDTAKSIVADEIAKAVIGGQSAQSDREALAASLKRSRGPGAIEGAISTFQSLLAGQLGGLRDQYKRTTGAKDFDETFLNEKTREVLGNAEKGAKKDGAKSVPALGTIEDGHKFKGGNPADPKNWEKI